MRLEYFLPSPQYRSLLTMHAVVEDVGQPTIEVLPAMLPNLHIRLAGSSTYVFANGQRVPAPAVSLIGPTNAAYRVELSAGLRMVAIGFLPLGWMRLVRCSAADVADGLIDGADVWGAFACGLAREQLAACRLDGGHARLVEDLLSSHALDQQRLALVAKTDQWLEHSPDLSVDALSRSLGVGRRHLQRVVLEAYGAPPKALAMKYRALRAAAWMATQRPAVVTEALSGYADQPHLNRDFRRFIGMPPGAFLRDQAGVTASTLIGRHKAGARRPLALWS